MNLLRSVNSMSQQGKCLCLAPACVMVSESSHSHLALGVTDWVPSFQPCIAGLPAAAQGLGVWSPSGSLCGERFKQAWHRTSLGLPWQEELQHRRTWGLQRSSTSQSTCLVWHIPILQALEPLGNCQRYTKQLMLF